MNPYNNRNSAQTGRQSRSRSRVVKKIIKKKLIEGSRDDSPCKTYYEVRISKYDKDNNLMEQKFESLEERPKEFKDINSSMQLLEQMKNDKSSTS